jgi:hypothetical protein
MFHVYILSAMYITIVNVCIIIFCANKCRRAARRRENCANDVAKLLAFFTDCKKQNPQFFCDFQLDNDGKIVSIFGHTQVCRGSMQIMGML